VFRLIVILRILWVLAACKKTRIIDILNLKRVGDGKATTFVVGGERLILKVKNAKREQGNRAVYLGKLSYIFSFDFKDRLEFEYSVLKALSKDCIAPKPLFYTRFGGLVIDYFDATLLSDIEEISLKQLRRVLGTIKRMHDLGYYHGDLNFGNILLGADGQVRLIDFEMIFRSGMSSVEYVFLDYLILMQKMFRNQSKEWDRYSHEIIVHVKNIVHNYDELLKRHSRILSANFYEELLQNG
jgi:RIO-like serine/threonine protein kinase